MCDYRRCCLAIVVLAVTLNPVLAEELGDPTRPAPLAAESRAAPSAGPAWRVESIIVSPGRRLAVINGRTVGVDEWIGGARVAEILPYEVRLEYKGEMRRVSLVATRVKSPATER